MTTPNTKPRTPFARFFSSVEGKLVTRYGSGSPAVAPTLIGATRNADDMAPRMTPAGTPEPTDVGRGEGGVTWNTEAITAITASEAQRFQREYDRAVRDGALVERTEDEFLASVAAAKGLQKEALQKAAEATKAEAKAKSDAEAKATAKAGAKPERS